MQMRRKSPNPALRTATCAALIAATMAVPVSAESIGSITRYCTTSWRQAGIPADDWEDCTQETMLELLSRLPNSGLADAIEKPDSTERRELMRSIWCVAKRWRRAVARQPVSLDALVERAASDKEDVGDREALIAAMDSLTEQQRSVLQLFIDGHSIADISAELDMPAPRVSDLKYKAIKSLKSALKAA